MGHGNPRWCAGSTAGKRRHPGCPMEFVCSICPWNSSTSHELPPPSSARRCSQHKPDQVPPLQDRVQDLELCILQLRRHDHRLQLQLRRQDRSATPSTRRIPSTTSPTSWNFFVDNSQTTSCSSESRTSSPRSNSTSPRSSARLCTSADSSSSTSSRPGKLFELCSASGGACGCRVGRRQHRQGSGTRGSWT